MPNADDALSALQQGRQFDLLLTDIRLPGKDGVALVNEAHALIPGLAVIFSTGYQFGASFEAARKLGPVLVKPYTCAELEAALAAIASRKSSEPERVGPRM